MFEGKQFPAGYMLGWQTSSDNHKRKWSIAEIIAHSEFGVRVNMIIEQCRAVGCYYGIETETTGNFLCALYVTHKLPSDVLARLREVRFPFSAIANKLKLDLFRKTNSCERIAEVGIRKVYAPRTHFSEEEDRMIISLQMELGNQWTLITARINESFGTEWSKVQVMNRFNQLEVEKKDGRKNRRVDWTGAEDAQVIAFRNDWNETHTTAYGMWDAMATKMPGKTKDDIKNRWRYNLSQSLDVTSTDATSTAMTSYPAIRGLSDFELRREEKIARNNARLAELGFNDKPKEAKTKVVKHRKLPPEDAPRRVLPDRKRKVVTYNEDEYLKDIE